MLKLTGKCHYCRKPTQGLFCKKSHEVNYYANQEQMNERRAARRREQKFGDTTWQPRGGTIKERIDDVCIQAYHKGTLMNPYERMLIEQRLGGEG